MFPRAYFGGAYFTPHYFPAAAFVLHTVANLTLDGYVFSPDSELAAISWLPEMLFDVELWAPDSFLRGLSPTYDDLFLIDSGDDSLDTQIQGASDEHEAEP